MSKNGGRKMFLRDSLVGWLGEFVALNKTPDCRLSSASQQFLNEAILEERQRGAEGPRHLRSVSSQTTVLRQQHRLRRSQQNQIQYDQSEGVAGGTVPVYHHARHASLPCGGGETPRMRHFLPQRFRCGERNGRENGQESVRPWGRPKTAISEMDEPVDGRSDN